MECGVFSAVVSCRCGMLRWSSGTCSDVPIITTFLKRPRHLQQKH